jgi:hypothetical protein
MHWYSPKADVEALRGSLALGKHRRLPFCTLVDDYSALAADSGAIFLCTTKNINITLPAPVKGLHYLFYIVDDYTLTVTADAADTMITFNDVQADSVAMSTGGQLMGGCIQIICDGTSWVALALTQKHTFTVAS